MSAIAHHRAHGPHNGHRPFTVPHPQAPTEAPPALPGAEPDTSLPVHPPPVPAAPASPGAPDVPSGLTPAASPNYMAKGLVAGGIAIAGVSALAIASHGQIGAFAAANPAAAVGVGVATLGLAALGFTQTFNS